MASFAVRGRLRELRGPVSQEAHCRHVGAQVMPTLRTKPLMIKTILLKLFLVTTLFASSAIGKEWRGIVPLKSNRTEVEKLLGVPVRSSPRGVYYNLSNEIVVVEFQTVGCDRFGLGWNVPSDTVVGIGVIHKGIHRKEEFLAGSDFKSNDSETEFRYYTDEVAGLTVETYKNVVTLIDYHPGASDERLRCPQIERCCFDLFPKFDEYGKLSVQDERARLDNFLLQMNQRLVRGTLEVIGPSRDARNKLMKLAERAKSYLVRQRKLEAERLLLIDGGYGEASLTRLSIYSIGGLGSGIYLFPEKDPVPN